MDGVNKRPTSTSTGFGFHAGFLVAINPRISLAVGRWRSQRAARPVIRRACLGTNHWMAGRGLVVWWWTKRRKFSLEGWLHTGKYSSVTVFFLEHINIGFVCFSVSICPHFFCCLSQKKWVARIIPKMNIWMISGKLNERCTCIVFSLKSLRWFLLLLFLTLFSPRGITRTSQVQAHDMLSCEEIQHPLQKRG